MPRDPKPKRPTAPTPDLAPDATSRRGPVETRTHAADPVRWVHDTMGNREVRDSLTGEAAQGEDVLAGAEAPATDLVRDTVRFAAAGVEAREAQFGSNAAMLRTMRKATERYAVPSVVREAGGVPLPSTEQSRMEAAFHHSFGHVRVHVDSSAQAAAVALNAHAFTLGSHVFFGPGEWAPGSQATDRLLAHELTHVVQADEGRLPTATDTEVSSPQDPLEQEAYANEDRVLARLDTAPSVDTLPGAVSDRLGRSTAPLVDGRAGDQAARAEGRLAETANQLGSGQLLRDAAQSTAPEGDGNDVTLLEFVLYIAGLEFKVELPTAPPSNEPVVIALDLYPFDFLTFKSFTIRFDDTGKFKSGEIAATVALEPYVSADVALRVDKDGNVDPRMDGILFSIPDIADALADLAVTAQGLVADVIVAAEDLDLGFGIHLLEGVMNLRLDPFTGLGGGGEFTGEIPLLGEVSVDARLQGLTFSAQITVSLIEALAPLPGVTVDTGVLTGTYDREGFVVIGGIGVTISDWFSGDVEGRYDFGQDAWSITGTIDQIAERELAGWTLSEATLGVAVENGVFVDAHAVGTLTSEYVSGTFDGQYDVVNGLFTGGGTVTLLQPIDIGTSGGVILELEGEVDVQQNVLVSVGGYIHAVLPWNGSPALQVVTEDGLLEMEGPKLSGTITLTALRELSIGPEDGIRLLVAEGSTATTTMTQNVVVAAEGGMAYRVVDPAGEIGTGNLSFGWSPEGSLSAGADFTLTDDLGLPERGEGPLWLKKGGFFQVTVTEGEITVIRIVECGFAIFAGDKDGLGLIEGVVTGTWDPESGVNGHVEAEVKARWPITVPWGSLVLLEGGHVVCDVVESAVTFLDLDVPFEAAVTTEKVSVALKGQVDCLFDSEAGTLDGHAEAQLTDDSTVLFDSGDRVVVHAEGSDFQLDFGPEGVEHVGFSAGATYYRGAVPFVSGAVENATYDVNEGLVSFDALLYLHDEYKREIGKDRQLVIAAKTALQVTVEQNALTRIGGAVDFKVNEGGEPLFSGSLRDVSLDLVEWTFTGAWTGKLDRPLVWPKPGEKEDPATQGLRLEIHKDAIASGRIEKNELQQVKAALDFSAHLLSVKLGHGHLDVDWDLDLDQFTGKGNVELDENFPLSRQVPSASTVKPQDWSLWMVKGSKVDIAMEKNILEKAKIYVQIVAAQGDGAVLAGGEIDGDYKLGDEQGFAGKVHAEVIRPLEWHDGDRFDFTVLPTSHFDADITQSTIDAAHGELTMTGRDEVGDKLSLQVGGDYTTATGFTGKGTVDVLAPIDFPGEQYTVQVVDGSGATVSVEQDELDLVDGAATATVREGEASPFAHATGTMKYTGGQDADASGKGTLRVLEPKDFGAKNKAGYRVTLERGAGGEIVVEHSALVSVDGLIPVMVHDATGPLIEAQLDGHYTHANTNFTGKGLAKLARQITLATGIGSRNWTFRLETETQGTADVTDNALDNLNGTLVMTVLEGGRPVLRIVGIGDYYGADTRLSLAEGAVDILDDITLYNGAYHIFLRNKGHAHVTLGERGVENFHGTISLGVEKDGKPYSSLEMNGTWTEEGGFHGDGTATMLQPLMVDLGAYGLVLDKTEQPIAHLWLEGQNVTKIGGHVQFRVDQKGKISLDAKGTKSFIYGTIDGTCDLTGSVPVLTGSATATVGEERKLFTAPNADTLWIIPGSGVTIDVQSNVLQNIGGNLLLSLRDQSEYIQVKFEKGSFDAVGGTGFTGKGAAVVKRRKLLFGEDGGDYSFWLEQREQAGATADIFQNNIREVGGVVPFLVKRGQDEFIRGAVNGRYAEGKLTGKGEVYLAKDQVYTLGNGKELTILAQSGGKGVVNDSKLERLGGTLHATYGPSKDPLMRLDAEGDYDVLNNNLVKLKGKLTMLKPIELLEGLVIVEGVEAEGLMENNELVYAKGKGGVRIPSLKDSTGTLTVSWRNDGGTEKYSAEGELDLKIIDNPSKKRKGKADKIKAMIDEAGHMVAQAKMLYEMSELISGIVDVSVDENLDPEISGSFIASGTLAKGGPLMAMELPAIPEMTIPLGYGFALKYGAKAGMGLSMRDLTYTVPLTLGPWRPISQGLEVPNFSAGLELDWGVDFDAAAAAWLNLCFDAVVGEVGVGVRGLASLHAGVGVNPTGRLWSDDGGFHGELGVGIAVEPTFALDVIPYVYAKFALMDNPIQHDFAGLHVDLGSLLSFHWNTTTEFGDTPGVTEGGQAAEPTVPPPPAPNQRQVTEEPNLGIGNATGAKPATTPGGPDLSSAQDASKNQEVAGGGAASKFNELKETVETVTIIAKGVAGLAYFIGLIKDLLTALATFGPIGLIIAIVWKIFKGDLTWDKIKTAALDVYEAVKKAAEIIANALPSSLKRIIDRLSGDKPSLLDALFGADDEMRKSVRAGDHYKAELPMRIEMVNQMMDGCCLEADEECILQVLQVSERVHGDFTSLVYGLDGGPDRLMDKLSGYEDTEAAKLMRAHGISYSTGW